MKRGDITPLLFFTLQNRDDAEVGKDFILYIIVKFRLFRIDIYRIYDIM